MWEGLQIQWVNLTLQHHIGFLMDNQACFSLFYSLYSQWRCLSWTASQRSQSQAVFVSLHSFYSHYMSSLCISYCYFQNILCYFHRFSTQHKYLYRNGKRICVQEYKKRDFWLKLHQSGLNYIYIYLIEHWLFPTHFAVIVEVRVKAHTVSAGGLQVDQRRRVGIVLGKIHIKLKAAVGVWGVGWACDENL